MSIFQSLRWRVQAWHGLLLLAVIAGFFAFTYRLQFDNTWSRADEQLTARLGLLTGLLAKNMPDGSPAQPPPPEPPQGGPPSFAAPEVAELFPPGAEPFYYVIWGRSGAVLTASAGAPADVPRPGGIEASRSQFRTRHGFREVFLFTPPGECLLVGRSVAPIGRELREFALGLGAAVTLVLAAALAGGWWVATRALRPIRGIQTAATRVADGDLAARIPIEREGDELGQLSAALNDTFSKLQAAFARQAQFTSDAAHELRTPVALILAQAQLALARERSAEEYRETVGTVQRAARRMHSLTESLLALAQLDARADVPRRVACDLAEVAREQIESVRPLAEERGIQLRGDLAPARCEADPEHVAQVLTNLLVNAVKFGPQDSEVRVETHRQNGDAVASVSDAGPGIAPEHLPHLFERFYRADASRSRATGGAGLGLSICQRIAQAHSGTLTVESELAKGSRFTLRIPI